MSDRQSARAPLTADALEASRDLQIDLETAAAAAMAAVLARYQDDERVVIATPSGADARIDLDSITCHELFRRIRLQLVDSPMAQTESDATVRIRGTDGDATHPLELVVHGTTVAVEWDSRRIREEDGTRLAAHLARAMETMLRHPESPTRDLEILSQEERAQILPHPEPTPVELQALVVSDLFHAQVRRTPEAVAVEDGSRCLSYDRLRTRVDALAAYLSPGVSVGDRIAIALPASLEFAIATLAVLRLGGVCVPLDPDLKPETFARAIQTSGAHHLLTQEGVAHAPQPGGVQTCLDRDWPAVMRAAASTPLPPSRARAHASDGAILGFDNRDTRLTRGVMLRHEQLVTHAHGQGATIGSGPGTRLARPLGSTGATTAADLIAAIATGATLVLGQVDHADELASWISTHDVTQLHIGVYEWQDAKPRLVTDPDHPSPLRTVLLEGLGADSEPFELACDRDDPVRILGSYGPIETGFGALYRERDDHGDVVWRNALDANAYVLDAQLRPCPPGVAGRLWIGGSRVAQGYWQAPKASLERFCNNPFGPGLLVRTSYIARATACGTRWVGLAEGTLAEGLHASPVEPMLPLDPPLA